jgi:hypothetical protein
MVVTLVPVVAPAVVMSVIVTVAVVDIGRGGGIGAHEL